MSEFLGPKSSKQEFFFDGFSLDIIGGFARSLLTNS